MRKLLRQAKRRGFTLIELMIVVAIIGILAVLAVFGVKKYLANAKTAEAKNNLGEINRLSVSAYEREFATAELIPLGTAGVNNTHQLCASAANVPLAVPANQKYQPNPAQGNDFQLGSASLGWKCLKFEINSPMNYQYCYTKGGAGTCNWTAAATTPAGASWIVGAAGDLNGDTKTSSFVTGGQIAAAAGQGGTAVPFSTISELDPEE
jgi:type IV pilus assembly protein PilA